MRGGGGGLMSSTDSTKGLFPFPLKVPYPLPKKWMLIRYQPKLSLGLLINNIFLLHVPLFRKPKRRRKYLKGGYSTGFGDNLDLFCY